MSLATPRGWRAAAAAALVALAACAHRGPPAAPTDEPEPGPAPRAGTVREPPPDETAEPPREGPEGPGEAAEVGLASFYGARFHGRTTASGARYDMYAMTCAHRTLPFGTRIRVTDLASGRSVDVTVTDRGPFKRGRVVDLSLAAARRLGMVAKGLVRVRVERLAAPRGD